MKAQYVSSDIPLIIRSSNVYLQPLVYIPIWWPAVVQAGQRPVTIGGYKPKAANTNWSSWWWAVCRWKHVEPSINLLFLLIHTTMRGSMNVIFINILTSLWICIWLQVLKLNCSIFRFKVITVIMWPHLSSNIKVYPTRCNFTQFIYIWKLLYMFRVLSPPIIRSAYNCIYSIWY